MNEQGKLRTPGAIQAAIEKSFPGFQHWNADDYHEGLRRTRAEADGRGTIAPYALVLDLNNDGRDDLVLDGHDQHTTLLLCVISSRTGYSVQIVNRGRPVPIPAAIQSWKDGRLDSGLNKFLSLPPADGKDWAFVIEYLPETRMHPRPPAADDYDPGVGVMFVQGFCAVDDRDVSVEAH